MDLAGKLLIAMPGMGDARFAGTLILVCVHSAQGAMGLIVNRGKSDVSFPELLDGMGIDGSATGREIRVRTGGPVQPSCGFVLHGEDYGMVDGTLDQGTRQIADGFRLTTAQDVLKALGAGDGPSAAVLMLGYAGWGPGQIEAEIARNDWLTADAQGDLVFAARDEGKWAGALRSLGVDPIGLSSVAGRA